MKFLVMSDLHLSKKPWQVRKALNMGKDADAALLAGDLTNDGSIRPTTLLDADGRAAGDPAEGNVVEIDFYDDDPEITGISLATGQRLPGTIWGDGSWEGPVQKGLII